MSTRVSENAEVESHYTTQVALSTALLAALRRLWPTVEPLSGSAGMDAYRGGVSALVEQFAQASISLSADYYEALRDQSGVSTGFRMPIIDTPPQSLIDAGIDWAMAAEAEMAADVEQMMKRVDAAMQKAVMDAGRDQVIAAVEGDELALGFARVAKPDACYFCLAQAIRHTRPKDDAPARPGVYKSRGTAGGFANEDFTGSGAAKFHNNCQCVIVPVFTPDFELEAHLAEAEALYDDATVNSKRGESLNDFRRALEAVRAGKPIPVLPVQKSSTPQQSPADALRDLLARIPGS